MISLLVRASLALLVFNLMLTPAEASRNMDSYHRSYNEISFPKTTAAPPTHSTRRGLGISAWGIVVLIVALILLGMGVYYFSICYEICRPNKNKYDKMGMPTMA
ncbi:hypothetical protein PYW07_006921 [Mythimna separata]|uniref:Uncharacterized protein n=1 Tax=Mythimna separata TaxID=271217 RepID=A0AAD7Z290_MYTSE|nr:hypothetical protein PYW07_006921 [Mythimna separata]